MTTGHLNLGNRGWGDSWNVAVKFCLIHLGSQWIGWTVGKPVGLGPEQADLGVNPGSATCQRWFSMFSTLKGENRTCFAICFGM